MISSLMLLIMSFADILIPYLIMCFFTEDYFTVAAGHSGLIPTLFVVAPFNLLIFLLIPRKCVLVLYVKK